MARTALNSLQDQIDQVRREAFAAGYAAAMQAVREVTSQPSPGAGRSATRATGRGRPRRQTRSTARAATSAAAKPAAATRGGRRTRRTAAKSATATKAAAAAKPAARRGRRPASARAASTRTASTRATSTRAGSTRAGSTRAASTRATSTRGASKAARPQRQPRAGGARPQRGNNARMIEEILQGIAPRAARPTEIRATLQRDKGVSMAFTSIRHALGQLAARQAVEQVGDSNTWRHKGGS